MKGKKCIDHVEIKSCFNADHAKPHGKKPQHQNEKSQPDKSLPGYKIAKTCSYQCQQKESHPVIEFFPDKNSFQETSHPVRQSFLLSDDIPVLHEGLEK